MTLPYLVKNLGIVVGLVLVWRGIWHMLDGVDTLFFGGSPYLDGLGGIVIGLLILYLPDKDLKEIQNSKLLFFYATHHQSPGINEEEKIGSTIQRIPRKIAGADEVFVQVIDDGSSDRTIEVAQASGADFVYANGVNRGIGKTFRHAVERALRKRCGHHGQHRC